MSMTPVAHGQSTPSNPGNSSFEEFRKGLLSDYNTFRKSVLEDYDRFLEAAWGNYEQMRGKKRYETPKPHEAPSLPADRPLPDTPVVLPKPSVSPDVAEEPVPQPEVPRPTPKPTPKPEPTPAPEPAPEPEPVPVPEDDSKDAFTFPFYGMDMKITDKELKLDRKLSSPRDFASQWRSFVAQEAETLIPAIRALEETHGLNDYLTFRLMRDYIKARYPRAHTSAQVALEHYLLCHMGYDVRLATDDSGLPLLLIPFSQQVYAQSFLVLGDRKYYVFLPDGAAARQEVMISTCKLPSDADLGRPMDLRINALYLPEKDKEFNLSFGDITLRGKVNENLMNVVYHYPQMATGDFAESQLSPALRADLVRQLRQQLAGVERREAVDRLLQFTQSAFEYATDQDFHGFEKPYFLEEILFYPKCDCEDRSIFYTYMLWNALGVENHLLAYPGHESASVHIDAPINGDCYEWEGKTYYISDPTFIGSKTGMCMPMFSNVKPEIDYIYR